jgi:alcohol dehydrogenase/L-iditol 2-dehydrogenase
MPAVVQFEMKKGAVELREMPQPEIADNEILMRVRGVGVCGSDVHQYHNTQPWSVRVPVILGPEFCGESAALGKGVKGFKEGDRVASETAAEINHDSPMTRRGMYNPDPTAAGSATTSGAMAEYVKVPARLLHRIPNVPMEVAAMTEPLLRSVSGDGGQRPYPPRRHGDRHRARSDRPLATMAKLSGAEPRPSGGITRQGADEIGLQAEATHAVDTQTQDMKKLLAGLGDGLGADVIIDSTGASVSLKNALD